MPFHKWGDEDFDWNSLYNAEEEIRSILKLARIGVHSKEKYGTLHWNLFLCDGSMHSITHPGHVYNRYPDFLWKFDVRNKPLRFIAPVIRFIQKQVIAYAFHVVCAKYPHIVDEIIVNTQYELLPHTLALKVPKMWMNYCQHCDELSSTFHFICPYCDKEK